VSQRDVAEFAVEKGWILYVGSNGNPDRIGDSVFLRSNEPMLFASFLQAITTKEHDTLLPEFLARWMRLHRVHEMFSKTSQQTTGLANFSWSAVKGLPVRFPVSVERQRTILRVLNIADETIRVAHTELENAKRLKTALLQQLFTKGLPGRHQRFKQTRIGEIPDEWDTPKLRSFADVEAGVALNEDRAPRSNAHQYLTVVNVQRGRVTLDEPRFLELWKSEVPNKLLRCGDIVVVEGHANRGEIGRAAIVGSEHEGLTYQNHLFRIRLTKEGIRREFLLYALNAEYARRHWSAVCNTSSGLNTINRRQLRGLLMPQPKPDEQDSIVELIALSECAISSASSRVAAAGRLRRSLLQNLLTGRVCLKESTTALVT
jgi:type I restriction enzyme, S subunit